MHISFTVPTWALIGFGTVAYPSLGAIISSFLMRASNRRLPGFVVALAGVAWPVTLSLGVVAFPFWLVGWFMKNYGSAIHTFLSTPRGAAMATVTEAAFNMGEAVNMLRTFGNVNAGVQGRIQDQRGTEVLVNFPGIGTYWVPQNVLSRV